jgi:hypothetical protein
VSTVIEFAISPYILPHFIARKYSQVEDNLAIKVSVPQLLISVFHPKTPVRLKVQAI